jgi:hypothetical protein
MSAEIPEPLMLDLLRHVDDSDGLDVAEDELLRHRRTKGYIWAIKAAWAAGRTAAATDLPSDTAEILAWLERHGLSTTPGVGPVLAAVRADLAEGKTDA